MSKKLIGIIIAALLGAGIVTGITINNYWSKQTTKETTVQQKETVKETNTEKVPTSQEDYYRKVLENEKESKEEMQKEVERMKKHKF